MQAILMHEKAGVYTKGCKTKEQAVELMRKTLQKEVEDFGPHWYEYYSFGPEQITVESVQETRLYHHRICEVDSIGDDNVCYECGESLNAKGRTTFAYFD